MKRLEIELDKKQSLNKQKLAVLNYNCNKLKDVKIQSYLKKLNNESEDINSFYSALIEKLDEENIKFEAMTGPIDLIFKGEEKIATCATTRAYEYDGILSENIDKLVTDVVEAVKIENKVDPIVCLYTVECVDNVVRTDSFQPIGVLKIRYCVV